VFFANINNRYLKRLPYEKVQKGVSEHYYYSRATNQLEKWKLQLYLPIAKVDFTSHCHCFVTVVPNEQF
jgi:hypothetical protein